MGKLFNIVMRLVSSLLGLAMIAIGAIWVMQGLNTGPSWLLQGFMVANIQWSIYGGILAAVGLCQLVWSNMRTRFEEDLY